MGKPSRDKGLRSEREFAKLMDGERVPLSGAAGGSYAGDVIVPTIGTVEVKRRANGFKQLYSWLGENDALAVRADHQRWLLILPAEDVKALLMELDELKEKLKGWEK